MEEDFLVIIILENRTALSFPNKNVREQAGDQPARNELDE